MGFLGVSFPHGHILRTVHGEQQRGEAMLALGTRQIELALCLYDPIKPAEGEHAG